MLNWKAVRPLDAAVAALLVVVIVLGGYLGISYWRDKSAERASTPASRVVNELISEVRANPNSLDTRMKLAQALTVAGRDREAAQQYKAALTINKDFVPALSGLGFIALKEKQFATGEGYYRKIVDLLEGKVGPGRDSQLETAYFYLGSALMEQKQFEEAIPYLKEALRLKRDASDTHYFLSVALRETGEETASRKSLANALLFDPKMPEANLDYGNILLSQGDIAGAAEHFRIAADAAPQASQPRDALRALGTAAEHLGKARSLAARDPKGAIVQARVAVALDPRDIDAHLLLGDLYLTMKDKTKALAAYKRALSIDPNNAAAKAGVEKTSDGS